MKKNKQEEEEPPFLLSKTKKVKGYRGKVREKIFQVLVSYYVSKVDASLLFEHIFYRDFFEEEELTDSDKKTMNLLSDDNVKDFMADAKIIWNKKYIEFGKELLEKCMINYNDIITLLKEKSEKWDIERISINDKVLLIMGITEMLDFPTIPLNTTIDEMVKIAKKFSTDKSYIFINGLLMKIKTKLLEKRQIEDR